MMDTKLSSQPNYLQRAKKVSPEQIPENEIEAPSYLSRAKKVEQPKFEKEEKQQQIEFPFEGENDLEREIERNIARQTSRIGETLLGLPGDLVNFARYLTGKEPQTKLPGSSKLRELSEEYSLGYTKPQTPFEESTDEFIEDVAGFMTPGTGKYTLARNIGIPLVGNLVKEGVKYSGEEKLGTAAKVGTMIMLDLMNLHSGGPKKYISTLYDESEALIPKGEKLASTKLQNSVQNLEKILDSGGSSPSKEKAMKKLSELSSKMKNGEIEIQELIDFRKTINEIKESLGGFNIELPEKLKEKAIINLELVKKEVINGLEEYGQKNSQFAKLNRAANEANAAYEQSKKMSDFIAKTAKKTFKSDAVKVLLGLGSWHYPIALKGALAATPVAFLANEGYKILHQVMQSPTLNKYYTNILKGAASGNASQVSKNVELLDNALSKEKPNK